MSAAPLVTAVSAAETASPPVTIKYFASARLGDHRSVHCSAHPLNVLSWSCRRSHKYTAALLRTNDGKGLSIQFLLLFIHKAPLIRGPGTAAGGMREISAASLVFAQAPALGVLALAALNFAR